MTRSGAARVLLLGILLVPLAQCAAAQSVSPGPLSQAHADLEGIKNCTQCHEMGQRVIDANRCLVCHATLQARILARRGYHGSVDALGKPCEGCHHEHAGRETPLVNWPGSQKMFDHANTGWRLEGAHRKAGCGDCHEARRIRAEEVRSYLSRHPGARTFLGLDTACASCHFDEHRGQLAADCASCHGIDGWKPAPSFDHDRSGYPLRGSHRSVACEKCHASAVDPFYSVAAFPQPRAAAYLKVKPVDHGECSACHKDPHAGRLGAACGSCHSVDSWTAVAAAGKTGAFNHDLTRFPLRGRHRAVPCGNCHPTGAGGAPMLTGLAFARCADCHEDAHAGQITLTGASGGAIDCAVCHTVDGFTPARFTIEDHVRTRYPLAGGHQAVPCLECHPADSTLQKTAWRHPPHVFKADPTRLAYRARDLKDCRTCHADPHGGQFRGGEPGRPVRACSDCHRVESFHGLQFDHGRDTMFPLRGKHARSACAACHPTRGERGEMITAVYRGTPSACDGCHTDAHLGQFASAGATACADCHTEDAFAPASRFDHGRARFVLTGAHAKAKCTSCHRSVSVLADRPPAVLYRPLPVACADCHEDPHGGAFRLAGDALSCETCHITAAWERVGFDHDRTGFRLGIAHADVACAMCHPAGQTAAPSRACVGCHADPHGGALGPACENCHLEVASFRDPAAAAFHERTRMPLLGRHAAIPCESCHVDRVTALWAGVDPRCSSCHMGDYDRTSAPGIDHRAWGISTACEECHDSFRWDLAAYPAHERCFPIRTGRHPGVPCLGCHTSLPAAPVSGCVTMTAACTRCHDCAPHPHVAGFECKDRKCYECHPNGGTE